MFTSAPPPKKKKTLKHNDYKVPRLEIIPSSPLGPLIIHFMAWKHLATLEPSFARMMGNTPDVGESNLINMLESGPNITMIWWPNMRSYIIIPHRLAIKQHSIQQMANRRHAVSCFYHHVSLWIHHSYDHHVWSSAIISIIITSLNIIISLWLFMIYMIYWYYDIYGVHLCSQIFHQIVHSLCSRVAPWDHCNVRIAFGHFCNELFCSLHAGLAWNTHGMSKWNDISIYLYRYEARQSTPCIIWHSYQVISAIQKNNQCRENSWVRPTRS